MIEILTPGASQSVLPGLDVAQLWSEICSINVLSRKHFENIKFPNKTLKNFFINNFFESRVAVFRFFFLQNVVQILNI